MRPLRQMLAGAQLTLARLTRASLAPTLLALALAGCGGGQQEPDLNTIGVTLPNGDRIRAELLVREADMARGMMFREQLPADRGLLFLHARPGKYPYWMYQVKVPLDIIWMDRSKTIVFLSPNTPPCPSTSARECPNFGGMVDSQFTLELRAGEAARRNLRVGDRLTW